MNAKKTIFLLIMSFVLSLATYAQSGPTSVTYTAGDIGTDQYFYSTSHTSACPGVMTVTIPENSVILSTDVSYDFTSLAGSAVYRQRSQLRCVTDGGTNESEIFRGGSIYVPGTQSYSRTGLDIANGITAGGDITFELHAGLTHYQNVCNTEKGVIDNNTWTVTVYYIAPGYPQLAINPTPENDAIYIGIEDNLSWDFGSDTETYDVYFGADNPPTTKVVDNAVAGVTGTYDPGTLTETQVYYWQVVSRNAIGYSLGEVWNFTTTCGSFATPITEDFESVFSPELPYCWRSIVESTATNAKVATYNYQGVNGSHSLQMTNSSDVNATLLFVTPQIEVGSGSLADKMINFYTTGSTYPTLVVGTMSDPADESTFTPYKSIIVYNELTEHDVYMSEYTGTDTYFAFKLQCAANYMSAYLDEITIDDIPTCIKPNSLYAENLTIHSAVLNWTDLNGASAWNVEYGIAGFTPTGTPMVSGVSNPHEITGLISATDYDFYVQTDCGGGDISAWSNAGTFTTPCDYFPVPFSEDFEGLDYLEMPTCWSSIIAVADAWATSGQTGGRFEMNNGSDDNSTIMLISPPVLDIAPNRIRFDVNSSIAGHELIIGTMSNPNDQNTFDSLTSVTVTETAYDTYEEFDVWLNAYSGTNNYFAFKHPNGITGLRFIVDNIFIEALPACLPPVDIFVNNPKNTSVDLNWTESGRARSWEIEVGAVGFEPGTNNEINQYFHSEQAINLVYELTNLTPATAYDVYIRTDCDGSDYSPWTGPVSFTSGFDQFGEFPITEGFESGMGITMNAYSNAQDWVINSDLQHSGTNSIYNPYGANADNILFMTGVLDLTTNQDAVLSFWQIAKTDGRSDKCYVEISTDGGETYDQMPESTYIGQGRYREDDLYTPFDGPCFDEDSYTDWGTGYEIPDNSWWKKEYFNLSDYNSYENVVLRFRLWSNAYTNKNGWYIDNIVIDTLGASIIYVDPTSITESQKISTPMPIVNYEMTIGNSGNLPAAYSLDVAYDETNLIFEDFNTGMPSDWTIVNNGTNDVTWTDTTSIFGYSPYEGTPFAWCDGAQANQPPYSNVMDEELITPVVDASEYVDGALQLEYYQFFDADYYPGDTAKVYVFDGADWVLIYDSWTDDGSYNRGGIYKIFDVTQYANADFQIKFRYIEGSTVKRGRFWAIDNVKLRASTSALDWLTVDGLPSVPGVAMPDADEASSLIDVQMDGTTLSEGTYTADIKLNSNDLTYPLIVPVSFHLWVDLSAAVASASSDEICVGGSSNLSVEITGGSGNETYSWASTPEGFTSDVSDPTVEPTETTTYTVEVTDNEITVESSVTVTVYPLPEVTYNEAYEPMCVDAEGFNLYGGLPTGGVYSGAGVSDGMFNPITAGAGTHVLTYTYTNENGCENSDTENVTVFALPNVTFDALNDACIDADGFALTGGSPAGGLYTGTGVVDGIFNPSAAGIGTHIIIYTYSTDFGCENFAETTIIVNPLPEVTIGTFDDICIDSDGLTLTGGMPEGGRYTGTGVVDGVFYPSIAGLGTYYIVYIYSDEFGCSDNAHTEITVGAVPEVTMTDDIACIQWSEFELIGGMPEGGEYSGLGVNDGMFDPQTAGLGEHTITYTYSDNGCENSAEGTMIVDACTGIDEFSDNLSMEIAPNPNSGIFSLKVSASLTEKASIKIVNNLGTLVYEENSVSIDKNYSINIDLSNQPKGMYFVYIITKDNKYTKKVIIR